MRSTRRQRVELASEQAINGFLVSALRQCLANRPFQVSKRQIDVGERSENARLVQIRRSIANPESQFFVVQLVGVGFEELLSLFVREKRPEAQDLCRRKRGQERRLVDGTFFLHENGRLGCILHENLYE